MYTHTHTRPRMGTPVRAALVTLVIVLAMGVPLLLAWPTPSECSAVTAYDSAGNPVPVLSHDCIGLPVVRVHDMTGTAYEPVFTPHADISGGLAAYAN